MFSPSRTMDIAILSFILFTVTLLGSVTAVNAADHLLPEYNLSIRFNLTEHILSGTAHIKIPAQQNSSLSLDMVSVKRILLNGEEAVYSQDSGPLQLDALPIPQEIVISFERAWPATDLSLNVVDEEGIFLTDIWHPLLAQEAIIKLIAIIPDTFTAVSEAEEILVFPNTPEKGTKQTLFRFPHPLRTLHFVAAQYAVAEELFGDNKILISYFFQEDETHAAEYRERGKRFLERYEKLLGPYPYKRFAIVENRLPTGFAMPTFTLLGQAVLRLPFIKDISLGHEILHEWFGNSVGIDIHGGNWAEGLTAYLADHAFAADEQQGHIFRREQLIKYRSYVPQDTSLTLQGFTGANDDSSARETIRAIGYSKSSMFFHMLHNTLGKDLFNTGLKDLFLRMQHKEADWSDLMTSFENAANIQLAPFFKQWLERSDIPVLQASQVLIRETEGRPTLSFVLQQKSTTPYQLTVPYTIITAQGEVHKLQTITKESTFIEIPLTAPPLELIIDPNYDLMRELTPAELPPTWSQFVGADHKVAVLDESVIDERYAPFIELLKAMDITILSVEEASDAELSKGAILFLGGNGAASRALFSRMTHPEEGITIDIRKNPLNEHHVAVLVSAANQEEALKVAPKLRHYGKYSYLHFVGGRAREKRTVTTENGIRYDLDAMPSGVRTDAQQSFDKIITELMNSRVIYVGENHTSYQDHLLQLKILRALHERDPRLAIGMEMFSQSTQGALDDYIGHKTDEKTFLKESKYFTQWSFDYRLYKGITNFAHRHRLPIIALNLERKIVSSVYQNNGTDSLSAEDELKVAADRDLDVPGYRQRLTSIFQHHSAPHQESGDNRFNGFLQSQALWDETMAEAIAKYLSENPDMRMVVIAGKGHTHKETAIPPRVFRRLPVQQAIVANAESIDGLENAAADYLFFSAPITLPPAPLLGVMLETTDDESGVKITKLSPKGKAHETGIRKEDVIVAIAGESVATIDDVKIAMTFLEENDSVMVRVTRKRAFSGEKELEFEVPLQTSNNPH